MRYFNPSAVVLIGYAVYASDDCAAVEDRNSPVQCYKCNTHKQSGCADPFNFSNIEVVTCRGACAKWVQKPKNGPTHIFRTCSSELNLKKLHYSLVCMKESRPGDGSLCFCHRDLCNNASSLRANNNRLPRVFLAFILACIAMILARWHPHQSDVQKYANQVLSFSTCKTVSSTTTTTTTNMPSSSKDTSIIIRKQPYENPDTSPDRVLLSEIYRTRKLSQISQQPLQHYIAQSVKDNTNIK